MIQKNNRSIFCVALISLTLLFGGCQDESKSSNAKEISFLALGDSYTIGESVSKNQRWPMQLADSLRDKGFSVRTPKIIAKTGWTTTDLQTAINKEQPTNSYDLVSLLIGVNNQYQGLEFEKFREEFERLLKQAITFAKGKHENVFVVSIPNYGVTPFGQERNPTKIRKELTKYNSVAQSIADQYKVSFVNITAISEQASRQSTLVAKDDLHPSGEMYQLWVREMLPKIKAKLP